MDNDISVSLLSGESLGHVFYLGGNNTLTQHNWLTGNYTVMF